MKSTVKLVLLLLMISALANGAFATCNALASSNSEQLMHYLKEGNAESSDPHCVEYALRRLGGAKLAEAAPVLAAYLAFHRPETEREKMGMGSQLDTPGNEFPAVWALAQLGKVALPSLERAIETETNGSQARENAVYAIVLIFNKGAGAVDFLRRSAAVAKTEQARQRLSEAAQRAAVWCEASARSACQAALSGELK